MEKAVEVMKASVREQRSDDTITPKVGAVLWKPDGTIETASRGELREGDHAEYTLLERKNGHKNLDDCVLFATLEPCAPDSRNPPKIGCARRIINARIKKVYYGCQDPHPKVAGEGLDDEALSHYRRFLFKEGGGGNEEFHRRLSHQGLLVKTEDGSLAPTRFGHLLFGKHPRDILPQAGILATIHGREGEDLNDFDGPMVLGPSQVISWLRGKLPDAIDRSLAQRKRINDAFYELVREGIANALVHRDYDIAGSKVQLVVKGDIFTIRSPGAPVEPITIEQLQSFSAPMVSRNPRLHAVFSTMELAEERGLGLKSMCIRATEAGLPLPTFRFIKPYIDLVLYRSGGAVINALPAEIHEQLSKEESERFKWLARRNVTTSAEFAREFDVDARTARRNLNRYAELGLVETLGDARARKYRTKIHV